MLEVLEHLSKDRKVLMRLPKRSRIIFSVPNFDSASHVRVFHSEEDVKINIMIFWISHKKKV